MLLRLGDRTLDLARPRIMGVLNVTPDSFSDGGRWREPAGALERARHMVEEGADLIDVGGESTRPGARPVEASEELARVLPVIERLVAELDVPVSIDTRKSDVARAALAAGASLVNDVSAGGEPATLDAVRAAGAALCLMHMQGEPRSMQDAPHYADVVGEVERFLVERATVARDAGIGADRILLDPGFGFGKDLGHNRALFHALPRLASLGHPLLVGVSRKRMIGELTGRATADRTVGSAIAAALAVRLGARIVRVHDVAATRDALAVAAELAGPERG